MSVPLQRTAAPSAGASAGSETAARAITVVLFDWDGTVLDSRAALLGAWHEATEAVIGRRFPDTGVEEREVFTLPGSQIWPRLTSDPDQLEELVTRFHSAYEETGELVSAFPGIHEGLSRLRDGGIRIAVVTSKARRRFVLDARRADLEDLIDVSVCAEDAAAPKPDPAPLLLALEALAAASQDALVVGDTEVDMIAGTRAGIPAAGVAWGASSEGELRAAGARIVAGAPGELVAYVLGGSERQV